MKKLLFPIIICLVLLIGGCATKGTTRLDTDSVTDIGDKWNDTDSRLVAEEMIQDVLSRGWLKKYVRTHKGNSPTVIVGKVKNRSHEHINIQTFVNDLERALINSGEVEFVASKTEREEIREERLDQAMHASEKSAKSAGEEVGADFMLKGTLNSIMGKEGGKSIKFYQVDLTLIDLESNKKVWVGNKKIKKLIVKSRLSW